MSRRQVIWFFREAATDDRFRDLFEAAGFATHFIPVLQTQFVELPDKIPPADAVVVTSSRAVQAIESWKRLGELKKLTWFAIGPATRDALETLGITCKHDSPGTADSLARVIAATGVRRVLFLAGAPHRDTLKRVLRSKRVAVETRIVYRTLHRTPDLPAGDETPDWAVFFSPRGVSVVEEHMTVDLQSVAKVAIGPVTAEAMEACGWEPSAVAQSPTPEGVLKAVREANVDIH